MNSTNTSGTATQLGQSSPRVELGNSSQDITPVQAAAQRAAALRASGWGDYNDSQEPTGKQYYEAMAKQNFNTPTAQSPAEVRFEPPAAPMQFDIPQPLNLDMRAMQMAASHQMFEQQPSPYQAPQPAQAPRSGDITFGLMDSFKTQGRAAISAATTDVGHTIAFAALSIEEARARQEKQADEKRRHLPEIAARLRRAQNQERTVLNTEQKAKTNNNRTERNRAQEAMRTVMFKIRPHRELNDDEKKLTSEYDIHEVLRAKKEMRDQERKKQLAEALGKQSKKKGGPGQPQTENRAGVGNQKGAMGAG